MNISSLITQNAIYKPHDRALLCSEDGRLFSWSQLEKKINNLGNALLDLGIKKGEVVAIYLPNSPEFIISYLAAAKIGAVILPINIVFTLSELSYILNNSRAKFLIGSSIEIERDLIPALKYFPHLQHVITVGSPVCSCLDFNELNTGKPDSLEAVDRDPNELLCLLYTSGTTGKPKGVMLSCNNLMSIAKICASAVELNDQDLMLTGTPFCHIFFVLSVLACFYAGAAIITKKRFHPLETLELIAKHKITHYAGVPTMYIYMLQHLDKARFDLSSIRVAASAGAAMPAQYIKKIEDYFGAHFVELYGATETSSTITYNRIGHTRPGSVGTPAPGVQVRIVDDSGSVLPAGEIGEIQIKSPGLFIGYWDLPEATAQAFDGEWFRTGDLGKYDDDGYFYIVDRKKDMIISGGYNIYPRELEEAILQHPKIMEVAVIGVKDPFLNEIPKAFVRLHDGQSMTEQEFFDFCTGILARYKVPRLVEFIPELPKSPTGKILKKMLV